MIIKKINQLFNIHSNEWPRVFASWIIGLIVRISFVIAWTFVMAIFIGRFNVDSLLYLFIINGFSIILGTIIYSELIKRFSQKSITIWTAILGGLSMIGSFYISGNQNLEILFLSLLVVSISIFISQLTIFTNLFIEDLFTPLESERTFPIIESYEVIGGIFGGLMITELSSKVNLNLFIAISGVFLLISAVLMHHFYKYAKKIPFINFHNEKLKSRKSNLSIKETWNKVKVIPFAKTLASIIAIQFIIFTFVEYQFAKGIYIDLDKNEHTEATQIAKNNFEVIPEHLAVSLIDANNTENITTKSNSNNVHSKENEIAHKIGFIVMLASILTLLSELLLASKIIEKLGIVKSMAIHPIITMANGALLIYKFGFMTAGSLKICFEMTNGLFLNAYHCTYYSMQEEDRKDFKEFMDGIMKPIGILLSTGLLFLIYKFIPHANAINTVNGAIIVFSILMIGLLMKAKKEYTKLCLQNLSGDQIDMNTKKNSIEILVQRGHGDVSLQIFQELKKEYIHESIKSKLIETMGYIKSAQTLDLILDYIRNGNEQTKISAITALQNIHHNFPQLLSNPIQKEQILTDLKINFELNNSLEIKKAIIITIITFKGIHPSEFINQILSKISDPIGIANSIETIKLIHNAENLENIYGFINKANPRIKASAITALWFQNGRKEMLQSELDQMFCSLDKETLIAAFYIAGEVKDYSKKYVLKNFLKANDIEVRIPSAIALAKLEDEEGLQIIAKLLTHENNEVAQKVKTEVNKLPIKVKDLIKMELCLEINRKIEKLIKNHFDKESNALPNHLLLKLKQYYEIADQFEEAERIDMMLKK